MLAWMTVFFPAVDDAVEAVLLKERAKSIFVNPCIDHLDGTEEGNAARGKSNADILCT